MRARAWATQGVPAGLFAGAAVALFFLVGDLLKLAPLSTPLALVETLMGPGFQLDMPVLSQLVAVVSFGIKLAFFTLLHFAAFALLGGIAVALFDSARVPINPATGAAYGLVACTAVFYACMALPSASVVSGIPGLFTVLLANLVAGTIIGGYVYLMRTEA